MDATNHSEIKSELHKYESQYRTIISRTTFFLYERKTQIVAYTGFTLGILAMTYFIAYSIYSYILASIVLAGQWYIFYLYEKLRVNFQTPAPENDALAFFRQKLERLNDVLFTRNITLVHSVLVIVLILSTRPPQRIFEGTAISIFIFLGLMIIGLVIHYRIKIIPVVVYLKNVIKQLEQE